MAKMIIGGEQVESVSGATYEINNPATGEVVDTAPDGTAQDIQDAVAAADDAFKEWWGTPPAQRAEILGKAAHLIKEQELDLATLISKEQGKPVREAILELRRLLHTVEHYAGLGKSLRGGHVPLLEPNKYGLILKRPVGIVGVIVPWNFPVSLMGNKIAPALLCGNTIVVKPSPTTPLAASRVVQLFHDAGLPPGVLNLVTGSVKTLGEALLEHPKVAKISFTGSTATGRRIMEVASRDIKRVTLELGGNDPMIICDDANLDKALPAALWGRFFNCGQACLATKRLYLFEGIYEPFVAKLLERTEQLKLGSGLDKDTHMGPLHMAERRQEMEEQIQDAVDRGASILTGGKQPDGAEYEQGFFYEPTLVENVDDDSRMAREEVFGPALPIFKVKDLDEAIERANNSIYGLGSIIFTQDLNRANKAAEALDAGYTWINSPNIVYDDLPFGGFKQSGFGKEHGSEALEYYQETKSVVVATI